MTLRHSSLLSVRIAAAFVIVFAVMPIHAATFTPIHSFVNTPADPAGGLVAGPGGLFYGTTENGGPTDDGTIISFNPVTNQVQQEFAFDFYANGFDPLSSLTYTNGLLFGVANEGGANNNGTAFAYDPVGHSLVFAYSFDLVTTGAYPSGGLTLSGGKLYGVNSNGGAFNRGTVFSIDPVTHAVTKVADFAGGGYPQTTLREYNGLLYGVADGGGSDDVGTVFSFDTSTNTITDLASFTISSGGQYPIGGMAIVGSTLYGVTESGGSAGDGTIFSFDPGTNTLTDLHDFTGSDGADPEAGLLAVGGVLYGTTWDSDPDGDGTVFSYDPGSTTFTTILAFGSSDGRRPQCELMLDGGVIYGTTDEGGIADGGTIFSVTPPGTFSSRVSLGVGDGGEIDWPLIEFNGTIYGTTPIGGSNGEGTVFSVDPVSGTFTSLANFVGSNGAGPFGPMVAAGGFLYGTTSGGGAADAGTIFRFDPGTHSITTLFDFSTTSTGYPVGPIVSAGSLLYGTTGGLGDAGTIYSFDTSTSTFTTLHALDPGYSEGAQPSGLVSYNGLLYGACIYGGSSNGGTIFHIDPATPATSFVFVSFDNSVTTAPLTPAVGGSFLYGVTEDFLGGGPDGHIYRLDPATDTLTIPATFTGTGLNTPISQLVEFGGLLYGQVPFGGAFDNGAVFTFNPGSNTITTVADTPDQIGYAGVAGLLPYGGYFWGATSGGGLFGDGTLFKLDLGAANPPARLTWINKPGTPHVDVDAPATSPVAYGQTVTLRVTVDSNQIPPPAKLIWNDNTIQYTDSNNTATRAFTPSAPGDNRYWIISINGSPSNATPQLDFTVAAGSTKIALSSTSPATVGQSIPLNATVTSNLGIPTAGSVDFYDGATLLGNVAVDGNGKATLAVNTLTAGPHTLTAHYNGSSPWLDSVFDATFATSVSPASTVVAVTSNNNPATSNPNPPAVTYTATVSIGAPGSASLPTTGTVTFFDNGNPFSGGPVSVSLSSGHFVATLTPYSTVQSGTHAITAQFSGDANYAGSTSPALSQRFVADANTTTALATTPVAPGPVTLGTSTTLTATVTNPAGQTPAGSVIFYDSTNGGATWSTLGSATLSGGTASLPKKLSVGTHLLYARYSPTGPLTASDDSATPVTFTVNRFTPTVTVSFAPVSPLFGQAVTLKAIVAGAPGYPVPAGTVQFSDGVNPIGSATLSGGVATISTSSLAAGGHTINASYGGDTNDANANGSGALTVQPGNVTVTFSRSATTPVYKQPVTFNVTVAAASPSTGSPTGSVQILDNASLVCTATLSGGAGSCVVTNGFPVGTHTPLVAHYVGDASFGAKDSVSTSMTVTKASTTTALAASSPQHSGVAFPVTITVASVAPSAGAPDAATVTIKDVAANTVVATVTAGSFTCTSTCTATPNITLSTTGNRTLQATYAGSSGNNASTSSSVVVNVLP